MEKLWLFAWFYVALVLILNSVFLMCVLHLSSMRYINVRGKYGGDIMYFYWFDVAPHHSTVENASLSFLLVCNLCLSP